MGYGNQQGRVRDNQGEPRSSMQYARSLTFK